MSYLIIFVIALLTGALALRKGLSIPVWLSTGGWFAFVATLVLGLGPASGAHPDLVAHPRLALAGLIALPELPLVILAFLPDAKAGGPGTSSVIRFYTDACAGALAMLGLLAMLAMQG